MLDIVFRNGTIVDGTGGSAYRADVGIVGSRIVAIGQIEARGEQEIQADGLIIAPGFIDTHGHSDYVLTVCPQATSHLVQGYTTQVVGNCGFSVFPLYPENRGLLLDPPGLEVDWHSLEQWVERTGKSGINTVPFVGHNTIRQLAVGEDRPATPDEIKEMQRLVAEALEMGAHGLSTGLTYEPSTRADTAELDALVSTAAEHGGMYTTHLRSYAPGSIWPAVDEAVSVAWRAGVPCVISHLVLHSRGNWGLAEPLLSVLDGWRGRGARVFADTIAFPKLGPWWGPSVIFRDLYDASVPWPRAADLLAERIRREPDVMREAVAQSLAADTSNFWGQFFSLHDWQTLILVEAGAGSKWQRHAGRSFEAIASDMGLDPVDLLFRLIEEERGDLVVLTGLARREDHETMARDPWVMFGSDLRVTAPDAKRLPGVGGPPDARLYGEAIEVLAGLTRDRGVLSLVRAIHKLTGLPASCFGLGDRGLIRTGKTADITVFDYFNLAAGGSVRDPEVFPRGIVHVLVNGQFAVRDGSPTGTRAGRVLLRS